jgi:HEAT repeat protein
MSGDVEMDKKRIENLINIVKEKKDEINVSYPTPLCVAMEELGDLKEASAIDPIFEVFALGDKNKVEGHKGAHEYCVKECASKSLISMGSDVLLSPMIEKLDSATYNKDIRKNAIIILGLLGDKRAINYIKQAEIKDPDEEVRRTATQTLAR